MTNYNRASGCEYQIELIIYSFKPQVDCRQNFTFCKTQPDRRSRTTCVSPTVALPFLHQHNQQSAEEMSRFVEVRTCMRWRKRKEASFNDVCRSFYSRNLRRMHHARKECVGKKKRKKLKESIKVFFGIRSGYRGTDVGVVSKHSSSICLDRGTEKKTYEHNTKRERQAISPLHGSIGKCGLLSPRQQFHFRFRLRAKEEKKKMQMQIALKWAQAFACDPATLVNFV